MKGLVAQIQRLGEVQTGLKILRNQQYKTQNQDFKRYAQKGMYISLRTIYLKSKQKLTAVKPQDIK